MTTAHANAHSRLAPRAWLVFGLCAAFYILTMFLRSCPAIIALDLQSSFAVEESSIALISSATLLGYSLMQLPSGLITDLAGGRKTMSLFLLMAAVSTLGFALAPNLPSATAARLLTGLSLAAVPAAGATLGRYFPPEKFPLTMSLLMGSGALGNLLAALPLASLSVSLGWRNAMLLAAAVCFALGVAVFALVRDNRSMAPGMELQAVQKPKEKSRGRAFLYISTVLRTPQFIVMTAWVSCVSMVYFAFMAMWAGPFLMQACGMTKMDAAHVLLGQGIISIAAIPLVTALGKKAGTRKRVFIMTSACGLAACLMLMQAGPQLGKPGLIVCCMLIASMATGGVTCAFAQIRTYFPKELTGTGIGCTNMIWPLCAAVLSYIFGLVLEGRKMGLLSGIASPDAAQTLAAVQGAYVFSLGIFAALWLAALVLAIFFVRERFTVRVGGALAAHLQQA